MRAVGGLHEGGDDGAPGVHIPGADERAPGQDRDNGCVHAEVESSDEADGDEDGAGDGAGGVLHFGAEEGDVVVAPVVVCRNEHGGAEAGEEGRGEMEGSGGKVEGLGDVSVGEAGDEDPEDGDHDGAPHDGGDDADSGEVAVEEDDGEEDGGDGDERAGSGGEPGGVRAEMEQVGRGVASQRRIEPAGVLGETDASAGDGERCGDGELKDEEEGEEPAEGVAALRAGVDGAEEVVGASGLGHGGAEFGPGEAVDEGEAGAQDPAEHCLRAAHRAEDERQRDEGADADHVEHVQGDGTAEREGAVECGCGLRVDGRSLSRVQMAGDA